MVINPLFVDDTDTSNDGMISKDNQATTPVVSEQSKSNRDHYVTVFTISNGEVTFHRKGSQKWFTDASTDNPLPEVADEVKSHTTHTSCGISTCTPQRVSRSTDRKLKSSISGSLDRKYTAVPSSTHQSDEPTRRYNREAILRKQSRGGRKTDYGFIDSEAILRAYDQTSTGSGDIPPGSALTDDEKVAAKICDGSLDENASAAILLVHPHYEVRE